MGGRERRTNERQTEEREIDGGEGERDGGERMIEGGEGKRGRLSERQKEKWSDSKW